jgi:hypothetical protein
MTNKTTVELLNNHFDIALETPDGVKKLRELPLGLILCLEKDREQIELWEINQKHS